MSNKKKGAKVKKEQLEDPSTLKDGASEYYIGGWSYNDALESLTDISHGIIQAHTNEKREVAPLERTNVLVLSYPPEENDIRTVEVVDKMHIEGVTRKAVLQSKEHDAPLLKAKPVPPPEEGADGAEAPTEEAGAAEAAPEVPDEAPAAEEEQLHPLSAVTTQVGADFSSRDVQLSGSLSLQGVLPQIVVQPNMPPPLDPVASGAADAKDTKGKKGKKPKITPEEQAELDRKRAEEEAALLQKTEEAVALAQKQEEYLMTFAHPNRWATVEVSNVTFTGPVVVRRAHVTFRNCCFVAATPHEAQLSVSQYCQVTCNKCTFEAPQHSGLYVLPTATVRASKCLFTGIPEESLVDSLGTGGRGGEDNGEEGYDQAKEDFLLAPALRGLVDGAKAARPAAVGVYYDSGASLTVEGCRFIAVGTGVLLRSLGRQGPMAAAPTVTISGNVFHHIFNTAVTLEKNAKGVTVAQNRMSDCAYYGLDCHAGTKDARVQKNVFSVGAAVRLRQGANVHMVNNQFHSVPIDENRADNPNYHTTY